MLLKKNVRSEYKTKVKTKFLTYWTIIKSWKVLIRASYQSRLSVTSQFLLFLPQTHRYTFSSMLLQEKMENVSQRLVIEFEEHNMHIRFAQQESAKQLSSLHKYCIILIRASPMWMLKWQWALLHFETKKWLNFSGWWSDKVHYNYIHGAIAMH